MSHPIITECPVCHKELKVKKLTCDYCDTSIEGHFHPCEFCSLDKEMLYFMKSFIKAQGNIKEVERTLGISYPTVKSKLNQLIKAIDNDSFIPIYTFNSKKEILNALSEKKITAEEAGKLIDQL